MKKNFIIGILVLLGFFCFFLFFKNKEDLINISAVNKDYLNEESEGFTFKEEKVCDCDQYCQVEKMNLENLVFNDSEFSFYLKTNSCANLFLNKINYESLDKDKINLEIKLLNKEKNLCKCEEVRKITINKKDNFVFKSIKVYYKEWDNDELVFEK